MPSSGIICTAVTLKLVRFRYRSKANANMYPKMIHRTRRRDERTDLTAAPCI